MNKEVNEILMGTSAIVKEQEAESSVSQKPPLLEAQFYSDALNESNINSIINDQKPELIVLFGLNDLGKTTFVGSLYHLLRINGEIDDYEFIDSDTFVGFERRIFLRRCNKEGKSITNRTLRAENHFLTLHLEHKQTKEMRDIVLSDRAGECYRDYISKDEELLKDKTIKHADRILIFINAEELIGRPYSNMKDELRTLLRRLKEKNMLPFSATKYIIFNKYDQVDSPENELFKKHKNEIIVLIEEMFESTELEQFCVNSKSLDDNKDLENLFKCLIKPLIVKKPDPALDWVKIAIKSIKA